MRRNNWASVHHYVEEIMRFVCLGYADERAWDAMSQREQSEMMEECLAFDEALHNGGHWVAAGEALQSVRTAKTLRWKNGKVMVTDGPFAETKEQLGGFFVFEARDMNHAIELMSKHPGVRFGPFEIRPADEQINAIVAERHRRLKEKTKRRSRSKARGTIAGQVHAELAQT
jgi:hypothetical protein